MFPSVRSHRTSSFLLAFCFISLQLVLTVFSPIFSHAQVVSPHYTLAKTLGITLDRLLKAELEEQVFVHWVHLNRDHRTDAVILMKSDSNSCGISEDCIGKILEATDDGFRVVSVFLPNHHPIYFSSLSDSQDFKNFYFTEDGQSFQEFSLKEGRYRYTRKELSQGMVEAIAPKVVTEDQFDNLADQISAIKKSGIQPQGAPIVLNVVTPAVMDKNPLVDSSYQSALQLESAIRAFLDNFAQTFHLSHTVTVELAPCDDWVARISLQNQEDRSTKHIVICQEILGMAHDQFHDLVIRHELAIIRNILNARAKTDTSLTPGKIEDIAKNSQIRLKKQLLQAQTAIEKNFHLSFDPLSEETQVNGLLFIIMGSLGQALSLQDNASKIVLAHVDADQTLDSATLQMVRRKLTKEPLHLYYLFSWLVSPQAILSLGEPGKDIISRIVFFNNVTRTLNRIERAEYSVLQKDMDLRIWAGACAERNQPDSREKPLLLYFNKRFKQNWEFCDYIRERLNQLLTNRNDT